VIASFFPLAEAARAVAGRLVEVRDLTPGGTEPHDLELDTDDRDAIEDAALVVVMGGGFQPGPEEAASQRDGPTLAVLDELGVDRDRAERDPHVWLDPVLMARLVDEVTAALERVDPAHTRTYRRRGAEYVDALGALDAEYRAGLVECDRRVLVTAHSAFGWLARRYDLHEEGIAGISPEAEPDPRRLAELTDLVEREGVTTVFTEELVSPKVARTLAREAGVRTEVLSTLEGLTTREQRRGATYLSVMRQNLEKLRRALGCR
jgi:zinc transport system substrate-binding protein